MILVNPLSMEFKSTQLNYPDGVGDERADSSFSKGFRRQKLSAPVADPPPIFALCCRAPLQLFLDYLLVSLTWVRKYTV